MSLNGVWVMEIAGVNGWERTSTVYLENGRYLGGGEFFFGQGQYTCKKDKVKIVTQVTRHGKKRVAFGEKRKKFSTVIKGINNNGIINGYISLKDAHSTMAKYPVRLLRQADLIKFSKNKGK